MNRHIKALTRGVVSLALLTSMQIAWSEAECDTPSCTQLYDQLAQLQTQLSATRSQVVELQSALTYVKQDVGTLQRSKVKHVATQSSDASTIRTGRGNRSSIAYPY